MPGPNDPISSSADENRSGLDALVESARGVLRANQVDDFTKPSLELYPHQWSWDTGFIAIGYSTFDEERGRRELSRLFDAQWSNGMVPHIVFNDEADNGYFPGPSVWGAGRAQAAPAGVRTSGITQPPVHATAALCVYRRSADEGRAREWLRALYPKLLASHRFFYTERDPFDEGLVYIRHPWESGLDNSPTWDGPLATIDPSTVSEYTRQDLSRGVEAAIFAECPFLVQDTLVNAILAKANDDLAEIGRIIDEPMAEVEDWARRTKVR